MQISARRRGTYETLEESRVWFVNESHVARSLNDSLAEINEPLFVAILLAQRVGFRIKSDTEKGVHL